MIGYIVKYGGMLQIGDFIGIGDSYGMMFGWFSGTGKTGTLQYVAPYSVIGEWRGYNHRMNNQSTTTPYPKDRRGFTLDHIGKSHVLKHRSDRVVKITSPEDCFLGTDLQNYLDAKKILTDMNFLKR